MARSVNFDRAVSFYDETRGFPPGIDQRAAALIAQAAALDNTKSVLEIGIGTGRMALPLSNHVGTVYGADISAGMLGELLAKRDQARIYPTQADAAHLPYATASMDGVLVSHVFHLVADLPGVIAELRRVLKPDGRVAHCWSTDDGILYELRQAWKDGAGRSSDARWQAANTALDDDGWLHIQTQTLSYTSKQSPQAIIERFERRIWSSTWHLTDEEHANGLSAMLAYATASYDDLNTPVEVTNSFQVAVYRPG